jgi:hypothetical protein
VVFALYSFLNLPVMYTYDTVVEAIKGLKQRGYSIDFNLQADRLVCPHTPLSLSSADFEIAEVYRFEGDSDPADEAAVYAIESADGRKGLLVTGFGISAEGTGEEMVEKLKYLRAPNRLK